MHMPAELRDDIIALLPDLRAFSGSLAGDPALADDLVQETLVKVWSRYETFRLGTNLRAWLFTILRNEFYSHHRRRRREVLDGDGHFLDRAITEAPQPGHMEMGDVARSLAHLNDEQREALVLFAAAGFSYEEVAQICGCAMGTVKSRINRARKRMARMLANEPGQGPDGKGPRCRSPSARPSANLRDQRRQRAGGLAAGPGPMRHSSGGGSADSAGAGPYRRPEEICGAAELDWAQKLHLLNGWRRQVRQDMEAGAYDRACGDALLGELNLALRRMAGAAFRNSSRAA